MNPSSPPESRSKAEIALRSHLPPYLPNRAFDVYVFAGGDEFQDLVKKCEKLLELHPAVYVHAVGRRCIPVAVNVAQQLKEDSRLAAAAASPGGGDRESKVLRV